MDVWIERFNYLKVNVDGRFAVCGIAEMGWQECAKGPPHLAVFCLGIGNKLALP